MKNKLLLFGYVFAATFGAFVVGLNLGGISGTWRNHPCEQSAGRRLEV